MQTKEKEIQEEQGGVFNEGNLLSQQNNEEVYEQEQNNNQKTVLAKINEHRWSILSAVAIIFALIIFLPIVVNPYAKYYGRYNLSYLYDSYSEIGLSDYEYNYIELKKDGTYYMKNKTITNSVVTEQHGTYIIEDDVITLKTSSGGTSTTEEHIIEDEEIEISMWIGIRLISFYFTKE